MESAWEVGDVGLLHHAAHATHAAHVHAAHAAAHSAAHATTHHAVVMVVIAASALLQPGFR